LSLSASSSLNTSESCALETAMPRRRRPSRTSCVCERREGRRTAGMGQGGAGAPRTDKKRVGQRASRLRIAPRFVRFHEAVKRPRTMGGSRGRARVGGRGRTAKLSDPSRFVSNESKSFMVRDSPRPRRRRSALGGKGGTRNERKRHPKFVSTDSDTHPAGSD
jgi:hypothetical protein